MTEPITPASPGEAAAQSSQMTYAEEQGHGPFDWNKFLREEHTQEEWDEACIEASDWVTCACGNQCAVLPRENNGLPSDEVLAQYGIGFYYAIGVKDVYKAKVVLRKIEQRSRELLAAMNNESTTN